LKNETGLSQGLLDIKNRQLIQVDGNKSGELPIKFLLKSPPDRWQKPLLPVKSLFFVIPTLRDDGRHRHYYIRLLIHCSEELFIILGDSYPFENELHSLSWIVV